MFWEEHYVYTGVTYFLVFCGVAEFRYDTRTGRIIKSRCGSILFILATTSFTLKANWINLPLDLSQYKLMTFLISIYPYARMMSILSCIICAQRQQKRIIQMKNYLIKLKESVFEFNSSVITAQQAYLKQILWIRLLFFLPRLVLIFILLHKRRMNMFYCLKGFAIWISFHSLCYNLSNVSDPLETSNLEYLLQESIPRNEKNSENVKMSPIVL